jgi:ubiquinol-cytochrome c reductase cytochrome c1 subunit
MFRPLLRNARRATASLRNPFDFSRSISISQNRNHHNNNNNDETFNWSSRIGGLCLAGALVGGSVVFASDDSIHAPSYPWSHNGAFNSFDTASLRRGFEVYRNVCASCHSMDFVCYRNLVGVTHTEEQAKALAASYTFMDGPNDEGAMFERPGKLSDKFKRPYNNDEHARFINGGALPPDLSLMAKARHNGCDYIFTLLTGYREPPAGITMRPGLHYNPYFPGAAIGMAKALSDGLVEYEDGTPATETQMAKDVTTFLNWCAEPEHDTRKLAGLKTVTAVFCLALTVGYYKRFGWAIHKTRKLSYVDFKV